MKSRVQRKRHVSIVNRRFQPGIAQEVEIFQTAKYRLKFNGPLMHRLIQFIKLENIFLQKNVS